MTGKHIVIGNKELFDANGRLAAGRYYNSESIATEESRSHGFEIDFTMEAPDLLDRCLSDNRVSSLRLSFDVYESRNGNNIILPVINIYNRRK
ncbi:MAG: hypothetical protein M1113_03795 [Candidatus Thermoplasmatota archaeon]|nr:hypothetical protein [Candidatus Thermoplasmatota archaeon]